MYFVFSKKFSDFNWKLLEWIAYISLMTTSIWFTWGVKDKFAKRETAIKQYEDKIEGHPTIAICNFISSVWEYQKDFNITYTTYQSAGSSVEDDAVLKIGENYLEKSGKNVSLIVIYTRYNAICYKINTTRNVGETETEIKIWSPRTLSNIIDVFFTSEKNFYGITRRDWRDGEVYSVNMKRRIKTDISLSSEKKINLKCSQESFYEYVVSKLSAESFDICNDTCLMTSLPNDLYPTCPNYNEWYESGLQQSTLDIMRSDCNWKIVRNLIQNITMNDEHPKTCFTTQYSGLSRNDMILPPNEAKIKYKFASPLKTKVYEEYFIIDTVGLIGSVGGTLGMFTGYSFNNMIFYILGYLQLLIERKLGKHLSSRKSNIEKIWKCFEWIIYISLMAAALIFAREVIEKFFGQDIGIKQNMEKIESHPTITICPFQYQYNVNSLTSLSMNDTLEYGDEFNVTYQTFKSDGITPDEEIPLEIGENYLSLAKEKVILTRIYTRWNRICYKINTTRKADFRKTEIKLKTLGFRFLEMKQFFFTLEQTEFFFTSEENSFGVTNNKFMDGKAFSTVLNGGRWKEIFLSVEKNINLVCNKQPFFKYVASRLSDKNFENCTHTCLRTSLPIEYYPLCPNYKDWYDDVLIGNLIEPEDDCNWGIVRNLFNDIITEDDHLKTCETIDYFGKIMTEKNYKDITELGIQYKFSFPLRAKVYWEFLIIDTIELAGSVGGMIGLFIGFSLNNLITYIIGYIERLLTYKNKISELFLASIEWIFYLSLIATSIWFAWGVLDKFFKEETGITQYEDKIEAHPTIVICMDIWKYDADFNITYKTYQSDGFSIEDEVVLTMEENSLEKSGKTVNLTIIFTRYNGLCYAINTTREVDTRKTSIKIMPSSSVDNLPKNIPVIFTSEMNLYGVTQKDWRDGEVFSFITSGGNYKDIDLTLQKNINLKCSDQSFYKYISSRLSEENFEKCNDTCIMTSLPNNPYPICPNYDEWYVKDAKEKEANCNWHTLRDLIQNITINEEHLRTCVTTQFQGKITFDEGYDAMKDTEIIYKFTLPIKARVYEEYLITDGITLIGSVGGTLGLFIGFSIINMVYFILDFFKPTIRT